MKTNPAILLARQLMRTHANMDEAHEAARSMDDPVSQEATAIFQQAMFCRPYKFKPDALGTRTPEDWGFIRQNDKENLDVVIDWWSTRENPLYDLARLGAGRLQATKIDGVWIERPKPWVF